MRTFDLIICIAVMKFDLCDAMKSKMTANDASNAKFEVQICVINGVKGFIWPF